MPRIFTHKEKKAYYDNLPDSVTLYRGVSKKDIEGNVSEDGTIIDCEKLVYHGLHLRTPQNAMPLSMRTEGLVIFISRMAQY